MENTPPVPLGLSVNPLPLPDIMEVDSEEKRSGETTNQESHCHGYALFLCSV